MLLTFGGPDKWAIDLPILISSISGMISLLSASFAFLQYKKVKMQLSVDSFFKINEINRDLLKMGFSDPRLFDVMDGVRVQDRRVEKRFLQLWLNQAAIAHSAFESGLLKKKHWKAIRTDIEEIFFNLPAIREHWAEVRSFYHDSFRATLDGMLDKAIKAENRNRLDRLKADRQPQDAPSKAA